MANPGSSSIGEDGVLLDLGEMRKISLSEDRDIATVGPAATWDAVYEELEKHERTVVGGRVTDVGVAGLVLGGAHLSRSPYQKHILHGLPHGPGISCMSCKV